jgi:uncharacterized repeat protein (TIGR02543 family)
MKTKIKWLLLSIILSITSINTASAYERTFDGTERVFFKNIKPSGWGDCWICASRTGWVHFWRSGYANTSDVKLTLVSGTEGAEGAIYVCTPAAGTYTDVTIVRSSTSATMTWSEKSKDISVGSDASLNFINNLSPSDWGTNYGHWAKYAPTPSVVGSMNGWKAEANPATSSRYSSSDKVQIIPVELSASTNYTFLIADGENQYGKSSLTITGATKDGSWEQYSTGDNKTVTLTTGEAGTYYFQYNTASKYVAVYYPKSHIAKNKVLYFDARNSTHEHWTGDFHVKYVYKYYDSGSNLSSGAEQYGETKLEDGVFYTTVPNVDHVGQVQLVSVYSNNHGSQKAYSNNGYGTGRSSSKQNCLMIKAENANWDITWEPGWQTYCPPMSSASISDNSTAVISWTSGTGTSENPYLVPSTGTIKVSASATSAVDDDNMTKKYDFKVNTGSGASSAQSGNSSTFNKTSLGNNTTYEISLDVWNNYNSTDGTKYTSATHKWYKALDVYTVSHSLTNMTTASGRTGSEAAAYGIAYTATFNQVTGYNRPASVTVMRGSTNITDNCTWDQSTGVLTIPAAQVSGNITITVAGEAQVYNITYKDKDNAAFTGTQAGAPTTHTYGTPTDLMMPTREHYTFAGWFTASNCASGQIGNTTAAQLGATAFTGDITLYAKWTEITHTVSFENDGNGTTDPDEDTSAGEVTGINIEASNNEGYHFDGWTITEGSGTFDDASDATTTFYPAKDATLKANFEANTYTATDNINKNGGDTDGQYTATYGESSIVINTEPTKAGFDVEGYYINPETSIPIADADGNLVSIAQILEPATAYVSDHKWIYDNTDLVIYPKWTEKTYTITLNKNTPVGTSGTAGTTSFTAKYNTNTYGTISSLPTAVGYTFAGYYTDDATPVLIVKADKSLNTGTAYINGSGSWIHAGDVQLYAHWTINNHDIDYNAPTVGGSYTIKAGDASAVSTDVADVDFGTTVTLAATPGAGYTFGSWSVTGATVADASSATTTFTMPDNDVTVEVTFTPVLLTFEGDVEGHETEWNQTDNWNPACVPTIAHNVVIEKPVVVNVTDAKAKSVVIYNDGDTKTGKLTVDAGKKLIVAEDIAKTADGSTKIATTEDDLVINSDGTNGVGALVWGKASTSPGAATVNFYSVSGGSKGSNTSINQFIGTPFTSETSDWLYNYYNSWVLGVNYESAPVFYLLGVDDSMEPFKGYCVIYNGSTGHTYNMSGTLVTNADHTCTSLSYHGGTASSIANENLLANPWLAPIKIGAMQSTDFTNTDATIYIFNSTSASVSKEGTGNYSTYPIGSAGSNVIPAMQSFSVFTSGYDGYVTLDYSKIVYDPAVDGTNPVANKAPKRIAEEEANKVRLFVNAESGYGDMIYMWERSDFNEGFENGWDGRKIAGDKEAPQFYAITPDGNMSVNCVPDFEGTVMGFKSGTEDNTYTFSFEYNNEDDALYLYDIEENKYTRILEGNTYTFSTTDKTEHSRFILTRNMPQNPTGIENESVKANGAVKFFEDGKLFIFRNGRLYDATGLLVK